ncbi:MAG: hypothetical protein VYC19_12320 [Pseudomonadota bacterium]|jgi:hypothetical protein|nr:hypothetical protein [Pseudomonadota bacterium]
MVLHISDEHKEQLKDELMNAFSYTHLDPDEVHQDDLHAYDEDLNETDLSHVFIQHGSHKKGIKEQSYSSQSVNGSFSTSKQDKTSSGSDQFLTTRNAMNSYRDMALNNMTNSVKDLFNLGESFSMDLSQSIAAISRYTASDVSKEETSVASAQASEGLNSEINHSLDNGFEETLDNALRNDDGSLMTKEQKVIFEDENSMCLMPTVDELEDTHTNAEQIIQYEQKLADPELRATITTSDLPQEIIEQIKADRLNSMFTETWDERQELFSNIAETHGITATEDKTAYEVYQEARNNGKLDLDTIKAIDDNMMAANASYEAAFDAQWEQEKERHMQAAIDHKLAEIEQNGGVYIPETNINKANLDEYGRIIDEFKQENNVNLDDIKTPLISQNGSPTAQEEPITSPELTNPPPVIKQDLAI